MTSFSSEAPDRHAPHPTARVSVVIPTLNAEDTVEDALASVVGQTCQEFEVLICDDGSLDRTVDHARAILEASDLKRWQVLNLGGLGAGGARNRGIEASCGEYVAFLDDDDAWTPEKLDLCLKRLDGDSLDLVCHGETWVNSRGHRRERRYSQLFDPTRPPIVSLMRRNPFSTSAVVVRRERLLEAGGFDEELPSAEDYDLWIRLVLLPGFRIGFIDQPLGMYRIREGSESSRVDRRLEALLTIGDRYRSRLSSASPRGGLEHHKFIGKTYFTSGLRYFQGGRKLIGSLMAIRGFLMWPFRIDWIVLGLKNLARRVTGEPA